MPSLDYKKPLRAVNFICHAPQAKSVSLVGDFNAWNPSAHPMNPMPDRSWLLTVELKHGHQPLRLPGGRRSHLDPHAQGITRNDKGERVCLVPVS